MRSAVFLAIWSLACSCLALPAGPEDATTDWDVIVVGAGTAGIIVADRLSEAGKKVLLLEQGGPSYGITGGRERPAWLEGTNLSRVDVPGLYKSIFDGGSSLLCGSRINAFAGCTVGGNSAINAGLYFEPPGSDWDWYHPDGWRSADVANATRKLYERQPSVTVPSRDGQLYLQSGYDAAERWLVAGAGYRNVSINDAKDDKTNVFGRPAYNYRDGQRGGPATTYLQTALGRPNFRLRTGVTVKRVVRAGKIATAVAASVGGADITYRLASRGRVVLSAGAIASPALLMYSGIGPARELEKCDKAGLFEPGLTREGWIQNEAVGVGLFDNPNTFIELEAPSIKSYYFPYNDPSSDTALWLQSRSGPWAGASQTAVFFTYRQHADGTRPAGVQGTFDSLGYGDWLGAADVVTLNLYGTSGLLSRGTVTLTPTTDPDTHTDRLVPGPSAGLYYSDAAGRDADDVAAVLHDILQALPGSGLTPLNLPPNATVAELRRYITTPSKYAVGTVGHFSSSCKLGDCVDAATCVLGTANVHVVDASILEPLSVNPQFAVMVAAERASELILLRWDEPCDCDPPAATNQTRFRV